MEEIEPKMEQRRGSTTGQTRRSACKRNSLSFLSCIEIRG